MDNKKKWMVRIVILVISCGLILYGIARGEGKTVLNKAVNICFECIGLG